AAAVAIEESVDEVQVAGTAAPGADGEGAGEVCFGAGGERGGLLVTHVDPVDVAVAPERIGEGVEGVAHHSVDPPDAERLQGFDRKVRNRPGHRATSPPPVEWPTWIAS